MKKRRKMTLRRTLSHVIVGKSAVQPTQFLTIPSAKSRRRRRLANFLVYFPPPFLSFFLSSCLLLEIIDRNYREIEYPSINVSRVNIIFSLEVFIEFGHTGDTISISIDNRVSPIHRIGETRASLSS